MRSSGQSCRPRRPAAAPHAPAVVRPAGPPQPARHPYTRHLHTRHLHTRGHLLPGDRPRCGCSPDVLVGHRYPAGGSADQVTAWQPHRHQHTGWRRAHLIYSDRMPHLFR